MTEGKNTIKNRVEHKTMLTGELVTLSNGGVYIIFFMRIS